MCTRFNDSPYYQFLFPLKKGQLGLGLCLVEVLEVRLSRGLAGGRSLSLLRVVQLLGSLLLLLLSERLSKRHDYADGLAFQRLALRYPEHLLCDHVQISFGLRDPLQLEGRLLSHLILGHVRSDGRCTVPRTAPHDDDLATSKP